MNKLSIVLKRLRESRNLSMIQLSEISKVGSGTIGDIERGKNNSTKKTLEKISKALNLNNIERNELFSCMIPDDVGKKLTSREKMQYDDFMSGATLMFNDETISDEDKDKLFQSLQEIFFETKLLNKKKKTELK